MIIHVYRRPYLYRKRGGWSAIDEKFHEWDDVNLESFKQDSKTGSLNRGIHRLASPKMRNSLSGFSVYWCTQKERKPHD